MQEEEKQEDQYFTSRIDSDDELLRIGEIKIATENDKSIKEQIKEIEDKLSNEDHTYTPDEESANKTHRFYNRLATSAQLILGFVGIQAIDLSPLSGAARIILTGITVLFSSKLAKFIRNRSLDDKGKKDLKSYNERKQKRNNLKKDKLILQCIDLETSIKKPNGIDLAVRFQSFLIHRKITKLSKSFTKLTKKIDKDQKKLDSDTRKDKIKDLKKQISDGNHPSDITYSNEEKETIRVIELQNKIGKKLRSGIRYTLVFTTLIAFAFGGIGRLARLGLGLTIGIIPYGIKKLISRGTFLNKENRDTLKTIRKKQRPLKKELLELKIKELEYSISKTHLLIRILSIFSKSKLFLLKRKHKNLQAKMEKDHLDLTKGDNTISNQKHSNKESKSTSEDILKTQSASIEQTPIAKQEKKSTQQLPTLKRSQSEGDITGIQKGKVLRQQSM